MPSADIIAHRGASHDCPENTLAAFRRARELGADGIELDVHLSADSVLVVHHDPVIAGGGPALRDLTAREVSALRVRGEPIPTLPEVLAEVGGALTVYCELKGMGTAVPAAALLAQSGSRAAVHAFDHRQIAITRDCAPTLARGVLESSYHLDPTRALADVDARDLWMHWELIDVALVQAVHARGGRVVAWTVNDPGVIERLAGWGVDALCTDDVGLARQVLGR